ncbi:MAG: hypothetical protein ACOYMA_06005 [Bacteroidia bacterium]
MINKFFVSIILCAIAFVSKAQFNTGAKLLSGNLTANIQNNTNNTQDLEGLKNIKIEKYNSIGAGIELGYGKITKPNKANIYGFGYGNYQIIKSTNQTDTIKNYLINDESNNNSYYLFAEKINFIPVKANWGFMYNFKASLRYENLKNNYSNNIKYSKNDSVISGFSNSVENAFTANLQINIGAYYLFNQNFILFTQLNLLGTSLGYTNFENKGRSQNTNSDSYTFNFTGVLTPTYKLGDFGIGLKYIIPAKN